MEIALTVSEFVPSRRRGCTGEGGGGGGDGAVCIKRRRRDPSAAAAAASASLGCNKQQGEQQADQDTPTLTPTTVKRSSKYRGVSRHRWTGRYEAHLWDKGSWNPTQRKKGKQVYLGAYDEEESAARAYDLAALKYWGSSTFTNFLVSEYEAEIEIMKTVTREEYLATLRRRSSGFSRGVSKYRGVARHHHNGRWEARIGRVFGNKYLYLGTYSTQEEAAHAYDVAAIEYRGVNAVTNFDLSTYIKWLKPAAGPNSHTPDYLQEPNPVSDSQLTTSCLANQVPHDQIQTIDLSIFNNSNPFPQQDFDIPKKQGIFQTDIKTLPFSPCPKSSSSSTALSLLLRSSIFKELVEKNLNDTDKADIEENNDTENTPKMIVKNEEGEALYDEVGINIPVQFMCPPPSTVFFMV